MSKASQNLADKAKELRKEGSYEEALIAARAGVAEDDECIASWYQVALNGEQLNKTQLALEAYEKLLELNDEFAYGWSRYGNLLRKNGQSVEALEAFETALIWDDTDDDALRGIINIYAQQEVTVDIEKQFEILKKYDDTYELSTISNINVLGNGYLRNNYYNEAINCYKRCLKENDFPYARHNAALAYACLDQHLNALDILIENIGLYPDYEPTQKNIEKYTEIINIKKNKLEETDYKLIEKKEYFDAYLNPFQLLEADRDEDISDFDSKKIQKLRKNLLQEVELEDGLLPWMDDIAFDKSKIISSLDELGNEEAKEYHWRIYQDERLLNFLSKGQIELFTEPPSPELINIKIEIRDDEEFATWLGKYYSKQYDKLLCIAIQKNKTSLISVLLSGRIFTADHQVDLCYEKSHQALHNVLQQFRDAENQAEKILPSYQTISTLITNSGLDEYLLKLPYQFKDLQTEFAQLMRNISISCNNEHDDSELSKKFLNLGLAYTPKNSSLALKMKEDENKIDEIIAKEKKKESHLTFGSLTSKITKDGIQHGDSILKTKDISSIRWGVLVTRGNYSTTYNFLLAAKGAGKEIKITWDATNEIEKQQNLYEKQIDAIIQFILPSIVERIKNKLSNGSSEIIGPCRVFKDKVQFETKGWFSNKSHELKWAEVETEFKSGMINLYDKRNPSVNVEMSLRDTDNAFVLRFLTQD
jgi:hypothetical protein